MFSAIKLPTTTTTWSNHHHHHQKKNSTIIKTTSSISLPPLDLIRFSSLSLKSDGVASASAAPPPPLLTSSIGSSPSTTVPLVQLNLNNGHILFLNVIACATAISTCWLFFSAIPALLAFKRAAESLEKLLDVTREELPDTMAAMRLSGMEISDLTMELSDLGQEITQGVRRSTRVVRVAEDRIRSLTTMNPTAMMQKQANPDTEMRGPAIATAARGLREGIVKGRSVLQLLFSLTRFAKVGLNYFAARKQKS